MSTRIHKVLGYGAVHPDWNSVFDRLDASERKDEVNDFVQASINQMENPFPLQFELKTIGGREVPGYPNKFLDVVHYADYPDHNDGNVVICPPNAAREWYRFDDMLDYTEELQRAGENLDLETRVTLLDRPLYPYLGWMDQDTGEELKNYSPIREKFTIYNDLKQRRVMPIIPVVVQLLAAHVGFADWKILRPMVVVWWS